MSTHSYALHSVCPQLYFLFRNLETEGIGRYSRGIEGFSSEKAKIKYCRIRIVFENYFQNIEKF